MGINTMQSAITELNLYDLAADDYHVWLTKNKEFGYNLEIESDDGHKYLENKLHPYAADSLADFCRSYLHCYEKINEDLMA